MTPAPLPRWARALPSQHPYAFVTGIMALALLLESSLRLATNWSGMTSTSLALTLVRLGLGLGVLAWAALQPQRLPRWVGFAAGTLTALMLLIRVVLEPDTLQTHAALNQFPVVAFYLVWFYGPGLARLIIYPVVTLVLITSLVADLWLGMLALPLADLTIFCVFTVSAAALSHFLLSHYRQRVDHDPLTGTRNRRGILRAAQVLLPESARSRGSLCVALIDLDSFKTINDSDGHHAGDRALRELADHLEASTRQVDIVGRLGGDEFLIIFPSMEEADAERALARVRSTSPVPFSYGVAQHQSGDSFEDLMARADDLMYRYKHDARA